jgi:hypothetical protein
MVTMDALRHLCPEPWFNKTATDVRHLATGQGSGLSSGRKRSNGNAPNEYSITMMAGKPAGSQ